MSEITIDGMEKIGYHSSEDALLTGKEVCELLRIKQSYLYWLTSNSKIPHIKLHGHLRFRKSAIEEWIRSQEREVHIVSKETYNSEGHGSMDD